MNQNHLLTLHHTLGSELIEIYPRRGFFAIPVPPILRRRNWKVDTRNWLIVQKDTDETTA